MASLKKAGSSRRQKERFKSVVLLTIALTLLIFVGTQRLEAQPGKKVRIANIGGTSDHIQVAIDAGIFRKHGFEVENVLIGSSATIVQSLIAGEASFAHVGAVPVVSAVAAGADLKIIAVFINRFNYILASIPEVRGPQDLRGKTLAISRLGSGDEFATREVLRRWNLDPDRDVRLLQIGLTLARLAALQGRHVHATLLSPAIVVEVQKIGLNVLADLTDLDVEYAHLTLVTKGSLIHENRPFVERFVKSYVEAIKYYRSHAEPAMAYLRRFIRLPDPDLRKVYESLRKRIREEPIPTPGGIQTIIKSLKGQKEREIDPYRVIDVSFFPGLSLK